MVKKDFWNTANNAVYTAVFIILVFAFVIALQSEQPLGAPKERGEKGIIETIEIEQSIDSPQPTEKGSCILNARKFYSGDLCKCAFVDKVCNECKFVEGKVGKYYGKECPFANWYPGTIAMTNVKKAPERKKLLFWTYYTKADYGGLGRWISYVKYTNPQGETKLGDFKDGKFVPVQVIQDVQGTYYVPGALSKEILGQYYRIGLLEQKDLLALGLSEEEIKRI